MTKTYVASGWVLLSGLLTGGVGYDGGRDGASLRVQALGQQAMTAEEIAKLEQELDQESRLSTTRPTEEAGADATAPPERTILVSVGPRATCWRYEVSGCEIRKLGFNAGTGSITDYGRLVEGTGHIYPVLSPDGRRVAFNRLTQQRRLALIVKDLVSGAEVEMSSGDKPSWLDNDTLVFGSRNVSERADESDRWSDTSQQAVPATSDLRGSVTNTNPVTIVLGALNRETGMRLYDCAGEDPYPIAGRPGWLAIHSSVWRFATRPTGTREAHTCPWLVGLDPYIDRKDPRPVLIDTTATAWRAGETFERVDVASAGITGCAHLSVSPSGQRLVCTNQPEVTVTTDIVDGARTRWNDLYGFTRDNKEWTATRGQQPMFAHVAPRDLADAEVLWAPSTSCHVYRTKQADFCSDDNTLVADLYCEDTRRDPANPDQVFARAVVVRLENPDVPVYIDLTSRLEDALGRARGWLGAYTPSCAK